MPKTITIPKELAKNDDLVVVPRKEYEALLKLKEEDEESIEEARKKHPAFYKQLDRDIEKSLEEHRQGKGYGPFETAEDAISFLRSRRKKRE